MTRSASIAFLVVFTGGLFFNSVSRADLSPAAINYSLRSLDYKNAFSGSLASSVISADNGAVSVDAAVNYQHTLEDDVALIWSPLPLGILYQLPEASGIKSAVSWNLEFTYADSLTASPFFDSYSRLALSTNGFLEVQLEYGLSLPFNSQPSLGSLGLSVDTRWFTSEMFSIVFGLQMITRDAVLRRLSTSDETNSSNDTTFGMVFPVLIDLDWKVREECHLGLEISFRGLGTTNNDEVGLAKIYATGAW